MERFLLAIILKKYQEMFEKKRTLKEKEEKEKEERKRKREEKLNAIKEMKRKNGENKKKRKEQPKNKKGKENVNSRFVCHYRIHTFELQCDECKNYFHRFWIPKYHRQHISDETDEDEIFLCHICYKEDTDDDVSEECSINKQTDDTEIDKFYKIYLQSTKETR